jgi:hypothetical protein
MVTILFFSGMVHNQCNLERRHETRISVWAHNASGYDLNHIIKFGLDDPRITSIHVLPINSEKFRTMTINNFFEFKVKKYP